MAITRELLTGNITLALDVWANPSECDHPSRFTVTITPTRLAQIRQMAAMVHEHRFGALNIWSIRAWDYNGDWTNYAEDDDGNEINGEPERMECCAIVVGDDGFHFEGIVKHTDIQCETDYVQFSRLNEACICDATPNPGHCPLHGQISYATEGGERDERLRTTD